MGKDLEVLRGIEMRLFATAALAGSLLCSFFVTPGLAADLGYETDHYGGSSCHLMRRSPLVDLGDAQDIYEAVEQRFQHALDVSLEPGTLASSSARYDWAIEAKIACGKATGYLGGAGHRGYFHRNVLRRGEINEDMISKCDCYYGRMINYH